MILLEKILDVTSKVIKVPVSQLSKKSSMGDPPNWDSVSHVLIIVEMESVFDVSFEFDELEHLVSIQAIVDSLNKKGIND
jgi:acyl carrier protein